MGANRSAAGAPGSQLFLAAAAAALLFTAGAAPAGAGTAVVYVDSAGVCNSLTPCFTTVQAGVDNAGPPPAEVRVFQGTYEESVDLTQMGSAIGGGMGGLALLGVDATGTAAPALSPRPVITGAAPVSAAPQFEGGVAVKGFDLRAGEADGLRLIATGDVEVRDVVANNPGDGVDADGTGDDGVEARSLEGDVQVWGVVADSGQGAGNDGIEVHAAGFADLVANFASDHTGPGADGVEVHAGAVQLIGLEAYRNSEMGLRIEAEDDIFVGSVVWANDNGVHGVMAEAGVRASVGVNEASGNGSHGLVVEAGEEASGGGLLERNGGSGAIVRAPDAAVYAAAIENAGHGAELFAASALVEESAFIGNLGDGARLAALAGSLDVLTVRYSIFQENAGDGLQVDDFTAPFPGSGNVTVNALCGNGTGGLHLGSGVTLGAERNWWGSAAGPAHPSNPGGDGEGVADGASGALGTVDFEPWVKTARILQELPDEPVATGLPAPLLVEARGADGSEVLWDDLLPGFGFHESDPLFSTNNGMLYGFESVVVATPDVGSEVFANFHRLTLVADEAGQAMVGLAGPCGLQAAAVFDVVAGLRRGDLDCDGDLDGADLLLEARGAAGVPAEAAGGCYEVGHDFFPYVFGDLDCDVFEDVDGRDLLVLAQALAGVEASLPEDCPPPPPPDG